MNNECCATDTNAIPLAADFLRILSEENRLRIICLLQSGEQCVCTIWQSLGISQNLTSHHLKVLRDFNLITSRKEGQNVYYSLNETEIGKLNEILINILNKKGSYGKR